MDNFNGLRYLFVFIIGFLGDVVVHILAHKKIWAVGLLPYYKTLNYKFPGSTWLIGGFLGGIACLIALLGADIILTVIN